MAITTTVRKVTYIGNNTATVFPFAFKVFTAADLYVLVEDASGNLSELALTTDYTVSLNGNQDVFPGGSITLVAGPLLTGYTMVITSDIAELQQTVLQNLGAFYPDVLNSVFDRLTILVQQVQQSADQSIKFPITDNLSTVALPPASQRAGKFLYFAADGSVSLVSASPSGTSLFSGVPSGTKDGVNTIFTLTNGGSPLIGSPLQVVVWKNIPLIPNDPTGFTFGPGTNQITYAVAPDTEDSLFATGIFG